MRLAIARGTRALIFLVAGVGHLAAELGDAGGGLGGDVGPDRLEGETFVVAGASQRTEIRPKIIAVGAQRGAVAFFGYVRVANWADFQDVVERLAVAHHVKRVDEQLDRGVIRAAHRLGALDDGVDHAALAALERLDGDGDTLALRFGRSHRRRWLEEFSGAFEHRARGSEVDANHVAG